MTTNPQSGSGTFLDEAALRTVFHAVDDAILVVDPETGTIVDANERVREMYGYDRTEIRQLDFGDLCPGDSPWTETTTREHLQRAADGQSRRFEWHARDSDGNRFWVDIQLQRLDSGADTHVLAICSEPGNLERTGSEERDRKLDSIRERVAFALDVTDSIVYEVDLQTDQQIRLGPFERIFGVPPDAVATRENFYQRAVHPDDRERVKRIQADLLETFGTGDDTIEYEYRTNPEHGETRWLRSEAYVRTDEDGTPIDLVGLATDVTERVEREQELRETKQELEQSNKKLEQFAYVASHDLQEPLRMVSSYLTLLEAELDGNLDDEMEEYLEFAVDGAERMRAMIDGLLQYSRVQTRAEPFEPVDAGAVTDEILRDLNMLIEESGATVDIGSLPMVRADPDQLGQLFRNLVKNAIQHGGEDVSITVTATERDGNVEFAVSDDGPGIPADRQDDVFDIFDTGSDSDGTGIGLAVCRQIVDRHGGDIWIDTDDGEGTTFRFVIPADAS